MAEQFVIKKAAFVTSAGINTDYPAALTHEIALVGRSNAGKSSLINCLCTNKKLARISAEPGKTRLCNFFLINDSFYLVDLPGYGFARASKGEKESWGTLMEKYLGSGRISHLLLLLDIRHDPTEEDRRMLQYLLYYGIPYTIIATKADKIAKSKRLQQANKNAKLLGAPPSALPFSALSGEGREALLERIGEITAEENRLILRNT